MTENTIKDAAGVLFLGIDGGGSKCKARLEDGAGRLLGEGVAGPANAFQNGDLARRSMLESARRALAAARLPETALAKLVVGAGLAGVNVPRVAGEMEQWQHPFARLYLDTDIHIACLAAHSGEEGAVIVAGTGSVGYSTRGGVSCGAHGFPFGDKGSGAWLGLEAMKAVLLALDGLGPETALSSAVESLLGASGLDLVDAMAGASSRDYGTLAPLVLECAGQGDAVARDIVLEGAAYLSDMAGKLLSGSAASLCMLGGLGEKLRPWMSPEVVARMVPARGQPDEGAVCFARQRYYRDG
jgi:glucosamine kinase